MDRGSSGTELSRGVVGDVAEGKRREKNGNLRNIVAPDAFGAPASKR